MLELSLCFIVYSSCTLKDEKKSHRADFFVLEVFIQHKVVSLKTNICRIAVWVIKCKKTLFLEIKLTLLGTLDKLNLCRNQTFN